MRNTTKGNGKRAAAIRRGESSSTRSKGVTKVAKRSRKSGASPSSRRRSDTYLELVEAFQCMPIRDDTQLNEAHALIDVLMMHELDDRQEAYLDVLSGLVADYEDEHFQREKTNPSEMLRFLLDQHGMTQAQLATEASIATSTISEVLSGSRNLTVLQICRLAKIFHVEPSVFLPSE